MAPKSIFSFLFCFASMLFFKNSQAQVNIMGNPGYMATPSAEWFDKKPIGFTFSYIPSEYSLFESSSNNDKMNSYSVRVGLTSFMEVNLSIAYRPQMAGKTGIGDRQLDFRLRLLKEKKFWPAIVLGWTPPGSMAPILAHDYLVATKHFSTGIGNFSATAGYGSPYVFVRKKDGNFLDLKIQQKDEILGAKYLTGFYGAFSYMPVNFGGVMLEYDTQTFNAGAFIKIKDWLYLQAYTFEGKKIGFTTSVNFSLDFAPKTLRRYEKGLD